jgi:hypothetical protein
VIGYRIVLIGTSRTAWARYWPGGPRSGPSRGRSGHALEDPTGEERDVVLQLTRNAAVEDVGSIPATARRGRISTIALRDGAYE